MIEKGIFIGSKKDFVRFRTKLKIFIFFGRPCNLL
jgi:hypothetical protein